MGIWGMGPFDNDSAADMIAGLMKPIEMVNKQKSDQSAQYHYSAARASAAIVLMAHGTDILGGPSLEPVLKALERMRADDVWLQTWKDRRSLEKVLDREIRALKRKIKTCCESKKAARTARTARRIADQIKVLKSRRRVVTREWAVIDGVRKKVTVTRFARGDKS